MSRSTSFDPILNYSLDLAFFGFDPHRDEPTKEWLEERFVAVDTLMVKWCETMRRLVTDHAAFKEFGGKGQAAMGQIFKSFEDRVVQAKRK